LISELILSNLPLDVPRTPAVELAVKSRAATRL
jgi:hypothetical protein